MQYLRQHIVQLLQHYDGSMPFHHFFKSYCKQYPKLGSRDRKALAEACYLYFRYAKGFKDTSVLSIIESALPFSEAPIATFLSKIFIDVEEDTETYAPSQINNEFSEGITEEEWLKMIKQQPAVFFRLNGSAEKWEKLLHELNVPLEKYSFKNIPDVYAVPNGTSLDKILPPEAYVVQDLSSQTTIELALQHISLQTNNAIWDVCAGAGGKTLLLKTCLPNAKILATDLRQSILANLRSRANLYSLKNIATQVVDSSDSQDVLKKIGNKKFDLILCDVPCSGSGTWGRTPENYHFCEEDAILEFQKLQESIACNAMTYLSEKGYLVYVTCSVFTAENENVVARILVQTQTKCVFKQLINGVSNKADVLFIAIFQLNHV